MQTKYITICIYKNNKKEGVVKNLSSKKSWYSYWSKGELLYNIDDEKTVLKLQSFNEKEIINLSYNSTDLLNNTAELKFKAFTYEYDEILKLWEFELE